MSVDRSSFLQRVEGMNGYEFSIILAFIISIVMIFYWIIHAPD